MARPTFGTIAADQEAWDAIIQDVIDILKTKPWPLTEHAGTEADLETAFNAAQYDRCMIMVNHSSAGWVPYYSTGSVWRRVDVI